MANGFEVDQVVGSGSVQQLNCQFIHLGKPAEEIKEIRKTVIIDNCMPVFDKVIIDGRLRKDIMFKEACHGFPIPGSVRACSGTQSIMGNILDMDVDISFNALIPVPGSRPGDKCVVLQAFVESEKEEAADVQENGTFLALVDKSVIFICVKVVREVITNNLMGNGFGGVGTTGDITTGLTINGANGHQRMVCPQRQSMGFFPGGNGTIPAPQRGLLPGTWIGPTLVFPGVLNPGIPTGIPLANRPLRSGVGTQVQIAEPGLGAHDNNDNNGTTIF